MADNDSEEQKNRLAELDRYDRLRWKQRRAQIGQDFNAALVDRARWHEKRDSEDAWHEIDRRRRTLQLKTDVPLNKPTQY